MSKLIALAGGKLSGKSTLTRYLYGRELKKAKVILDFEVSTRTGGKLQVKAFHGDQVGEGILDLDRIDYDFLAYLYEFVHPFVQGFSYTAAVKEAAVRLFGIDPQLVYGEDSDREKPSGYNWEDMPGVKNRKGSMTVRQFLQFWANDVLIPMDKSLHHKNTMREISNSGAAVKIIEGMRHPDQVKDVQADGFKVIHLTRKNHKDNHAAENSLGDDPAIFDYTLDNQNQTLEETIAEFEAVLQMWEV